MIHLSTILAIPLLLMLDGCPAYKSNYIRYPFQSKQSTQKMQSLGQLVGRAEVTRSSTRIQSKIAGGTIIAKYGEIPYQAAVLNFLDQTFCGGIIVEVSGARFILTAAHCVWTGDANATASVDPKHLQVVLADISLFVADQRELKYKVTRVVVHEWYDPRYYLNDIAILFLRHYIYEGLAFKAIPLPESDYGIPDYVKVSGYGGTKSFDVYDGKLRIVEVPTYDWDECKKVVTYLTNDHFCIQNPDPDKLAGFCQGDSGGPAIGYNYSKQEYYAYGIVSTYHGLYCGASDVPEKFTRISKYIEWIHGYALTHELNCGTGHPILDPPSKYPNCKWPYADGCHDVNCQI